MPTMTNIEPFRYQNGYNQIYQNKSDEGAAMKRDAQLKVNVPRSIKEEASAIYEKLGLSLADAINVFLAKSVDVKGLPFDVVIENPTIDVSKLQHIPIDPDLGHPVLPADMDCERDSYYDKYDS